VRQNISDNQFISHEDYCIKACQLVPIQIFYFNVIDQTLIWANRRVLEFYQLPFETLSNNWREVFVERLHPDDIPQMEFNLQKIRNKETKSNTFLFRLYDTKNKMHWFHSQGIPVKNDAHGNPIHWLIARVDITDSSEYKDTIIALNLEVTQLRNQVRLGTLTKREKQVIQLVGKGYSNKRIATTIGISGRTVETHRKNLLRKLNLHGTAELVRFVMENGLM